MASSIGLWLLDPLRDALVDLDLLEAKLRLRTILVSMSVVARFAALWTREEAQHRTDHLAKAVLERVRHVDLKKSSLLFKIKQLKRRREYWFTDNY